MPVKLSLEQFEDRTLPSIDVTQAFAGLAFDPRVPADLPDTILAVGPNKVVEATNRDVAFYDKITEAGTPETPLPLKTFFAPVLPGGLPVAGDIITDPKVAYDQTAGRFVLTTLELNFATQEAHLLLGVSTSNDPTGAAADWEMHRIDVTEPGNFADFPQLGWDADGIYVSVNMFKFVGHLPFDHARVLAFATSSLTDGDSSTLTMSSTDFLPPNFALQPAAMFGAGSGAPMYFVESQVPGLSSGGGGFIDVVQMTNKLSASPTFTDFKVLVPSYNHPRDADQPGGAQLDTGDGRVLSAAWRDGRLVASQTEQANQHAVARWYEFGTAGGTPTLTQTFEINRGPGVATFMPSINIAPNGDLAMTFLESSATEFLSMYLAGQKAGAPAGTFQGSVLAKSGEATLRVFRASGELGAPLRTGDYSGVAIDPTDGSFWAANEYTTTATFPPPPGTRLANWGTWVAHFTISSEGALSALALGQPAATAGPLVLADPITPGGTTNGGSQASLPATALSSSSSNLTSAAAQAVGITSGTASTTALDNYFAHDQDQHQGLDWTDGLTAAMPW